MPESDPHRVIDFHIHAGNPSDWHPWVMEFVSMVNPEAEAQLDMCQTQEGLLSFLDDQGVDHAVILAETSPVTTGVVSNNRVRDLCAGSDRLTPFASFHPLEVADQAGTVAQLAEEGFRGLKFYPSSQFFFPDDPMVYPVYAEASDRGLIVMFHTGTSIYKGSRQRFSEPIRIDDIAVDFPDLQIVMAHSGRRLWYEQAFFMAERHDNIWMELSGIPPSRVPEWFPKLERVVDRVLFGSDFPGVPSIRRNVEAFHDLPYSDELIEGALFANAARLLGIS
ncbi:MAG: amidohydrolase family protein [Thermoplasmata archaeon]|nr:amidohydrolase family protein [Thermoplasmata archaeon]